MNIKVLFLLGGLPLIAFSKGIDTTYRNVEDSVLLNGENSIIEYFPEKAYYTAGNAALRDSIIKLLRNPYPDVSVAGVVIVEFTINKDGTTENFRVFRGVDPALDAEAVRVAKLLKGWTPQKFHGEPVRSLFKIPVSFNHFVYGY